MKNRFVIRSKFDRDEEFDFTNVPKHFNSVTERDIANIRATCMRTIGDKYHGEYKPQALQAMLQSINGAFENAYVHLDGDYQTRRSNLHNAFSVGVSDLLTQLMDFELLVNNYNAQYDEYAEAAKEFTGRAPSERLRFSEQRLERYREQYNQLRSQIDE